MTGRTDYTAVDNGDAPDFGPQITSAFVHFDALIDLAVGTAASLPGTPFAGQQVYVEDEATLYVWDDPEGDWITAVPVRDDIFTYLQTDTTDSTTRVTSQMGKGKIIGNGTTTIAETITFDTPFAGIPIIFVTVNGARATGAYNAASLTLAGAAANTHGTSTTGATVNIIGITGNLSAANDYYYSWVAYGELP